MMTLTSPLPISRRLFFLFLFVSGWCALTYQVCWERLFIVNFGVDFYSVSAITAAFMTGLGIGALALGRYVDRHPNPLRVYAALELGIGVFGLLSVALIRALYPLCISIQQQVQSLPAAFALNFLMVFIIMLPPTIMMGGTLPVVVRLILRSDAEAGRTIGGLYAINTLGSVIGSFMGAFVTISLLHVNGSIYFAGLMNIAIGLTCWRFSRRPAGAVPLPAPALRAAPEPASPLQLGRAALALLLGLYLVSSVVSLGYEILWYRIVSLQWQNATGGFGLVLTFYLLGVVLGSWLFAWISPRIRAPIRLFASLQFLTVVAAFAGLVYFRRAYNDSNLYVPIEQYLLKIYEMLTGMKSYTPLKGDVVVNGAKISLVLTVLIMIPMIVQGMCFPLVARICTRSLAASGRSVGVVYFVSIVGSFIGSAGVGYLAIPMLGMRNTFALLLALSAGCGVAAMLLSWSREGFAGSVWRAFSPLPEAALAALTLLTVHHGEPAWMQRMSPFLALGPLPSSLHGYLTDRTISVEVEGITGATQLEGNDEYMAVRINGQNHGGLKPYKFQRDDLKMAIAVNLHPNPRTALLIGIGNGRTLVALEKYKEIERIDVVEISRELVPALLQQGGLDWLHRALKSPKVHLHLDDGRAFLHKTDRQYDIIASAPVFAYNAYGGYLYSREMMELVSDRLTPRGIYVLLNDSLVPTMRFIQLATFAKVFPHYFLDAGNYLHGSRQPLVVDYDRIERSFELNKDWLTVNEFATSDGQYSPKINPLEDKGWFLQWIRADETAFADLEGFPLNTDLAPRTEFWLFQNIRAARKRPMPHEVRNVAFHFPLRRADELAPSGILVRPVAEWSVDIVGGEKQDLATSMVKPGGLSVALARPMNVKVHTGPGQVLDPPAQADFDLAKALEAGRSYVLGAVVAGSGLFDLQLRGWDDPRQQWVFIGSTRYAAGSEGEALYMEVPALAAHPAYRLSLGFDQPCEVRVQSVSIYEPRCLAAEAAGSVPAPRP